MNQRSLLARTCREARAERERERELRARSLRVAAIMRDKAAAKDENSQDGFARGNNGFLCAVWYLFGCLLHGGVSFLCVCISVRMCVCVLPV